MSLPDNSVDAVVTDPPYGLSFMGKKWDYDVPSEDVWRECLRVLKPGGHLLAFAGTRTQHRMAVRIEDAGFEIRDMIAWLYGSGFPKSLDVSKAIDKAAGAEREVIGIREDFAARANKKRVGVSWADNSLKDGSFSNPADIGVVTAPATDAARQWSGWGTALKPAMEPITVARKPLIGTVAANVLTHGTGALNISPCRVAYATDADKAAALAGDAFKRKDTGDKGWSRPWMSDQARIEQMNKEAKERADAGRWPANVIHDGSDEPVALLGDAARFFYCAKASKKDRGEGNNHPTVKPTDLMRYLVRLVTPPGGVVLDPFMGSGSTGKAAKLEGFRFIGIEREIEYLEIARARIEAVEKRLDV
jgi:DNA modification methylase